MVSERRKDSVSSGPPRPDRDVQVLRAVTYQEVTDRDASARLGELCGRAARIELFEGDARSGDVRAAKYRGDPLPWVERSYQAR